MARRRDDDEEEDDRPRSRRRRDEDDEPHPSRRERDRREPVRDPRPGLATAAAVLWLIAGGLAALGTLVAGFLSLQVITDFLGGGRVRNVADAEFAFIVSLVTLGILLFLTVFYLRAGVRTLRGSARGITVSGILSVVVGGGLIVLSLYVGLTRLRAAQDSPYARPDTEAYLFGQMCGQTVGAALPLLAGIFALCSSARYRRWSERQADGR